MVLIPPLDNSEAPIQWNEVTDNSLSPDVVWALTGNNERLTWALVEKEERLTWFYSELKHWETSNVELEIRERNARWWVWYEDKWALFASETFNPKAIEQIPEIKQALLDSWWLPPEEPNS